MTTEEIIEYVFVPMKRHINLGDFHNAETAMRERSEASIEKQLESQRNLREGLNIWELEERENFLKMQQLKREQEEIMSEKVRVDEDRASALFRKDLLEFIEANPGTSMDNLVLTFEKSRYDISDHIMVLRNAGSIKSQQCRESFVVYEEDSEEEEES